jgi:predicted 2-oxoglutarate/Fe(II)-dependent dioxygenase YbiX
MKLFRRDAFLEAEACARIRHAMDEGEVEPAEILPVVGAATQRDDVRHAASVDVNDGVLAEVEVALEQSRDALAHFFDLELSSREGPGFLCYSSGGFYQPHRDRAASVAWPDAERRLLTMVVFLNENFGGGQLRLLPDDGEPLVIGPRTGTLVAFDAATVHEVAPVIEGQRYTVVDWWL